MLFKIVANKETHLQILIYIKFHEFPFSKTDNQINYFYLHVQQIETLNY